MQFTIRAGVCGKWGCFVGLRLTDLGTQRLCRLSGAFVACRDSLVAVPDEPAFNCTQTTYNAVIPIDFDESGMCFLCYWLLVNERSLTSCFFIGSYYVDLAWEHRTWPSTEEAYDSAPDSETLQRWEIYESEHGWY